MKLSAGCAALIALAFGASAPVASASTAFVEVPAVNAGIHTFRYAAAPGERNDVTVEFLAGVGSFHSALRISDGGAVIEPGNSCRSIDPHAVECRIDERTAGGYENSFDNHLLDLGDEDDALRFRPSPATDTSVHTDVDGGPGADTLHGTRLGRVLGGPGPDHLIAPAAGFDLMHGGSGADVLIGSDKYDELTGGAGPDRLVGRDGDDHLFGDDPFATIAPADAQDSLDGGDGNDFLNGGPAVNAVACGPGADVSIVALARDVVGFDCERVAFMVDEEFEIWFSLRPRPVAWRGSTALFRVPCAQLEPPWGYGTPLPCDGSMTLREASGPRRLLGRAAVPGNLAAIPLSALGMRLARQPYGVLVTVTLHGHAIGPPNGWTFRLRRSAG
ncbi:MAG TPA: calcium-binding protein [Solirubrobacteraceae bacterium]